MLALAAADLHKQPTQCHHLLQHHSHYVNQAQHLSAHLAETAPYFFSITRYHAALVWHISKRLSGAKQEEERKISLVYHLASGGGNFCLHCATVGDCGFIHFIVIIFLAVNMGNVANAFGLYCICHWELDRNKN